MRKTGKCYVYVLQSLSTPERHYIGLTDDIVAHLALHNGGQSPQTARHGPWRVHVVMAFGSEQIAARFEKFLKSGSGREFVRSYLIA